MSVATLTELEQPLEKRDGPGSHLHQARLARGLELLHIANRMHLPAETVEALERDDYDRLPGPVFIRGYLKNYARVLGIDADPVLSAYARTLPAEGAAPPLVHGSRIKPDLHRGRWLLPMLIGLLVSLPVIGFLFWWHWGSTPPWETEERQVESTEFGSHGAGQASDELQLETNPDPVRPSHEIAVSGQSVGVSKPEGQQAFTSAPIGASSGLSEPGPGAPVSIPTDSPPPSESVLVDPTPSATTVQPGFHSGEAQLVQQTTAPQPEQPVAANDGRSVVDLRFSGSCWLDIRDASGEEKIIGVMAKDTRRRLVGQPPFSVVLGDVRMVEVSVDGIPFDIIPYARGNVARFKIGEQ